LLCSLPKRTAERDCPPLATSTTALSLRHVRITISLNLSSIDAKETCSSPNVFCHVPKICLRWPGRVVVKTGRWGGVVTAFITMSDIEDEIDWEFPGAAVTEAQSNFFWQGIIRECRFHSSQQVCLHRVTCFPLSPLRLTSRANRWSDAHRSLRHVRQFS
jgi:hypothetical protein